jgi:hypothetical protein
LLQLLDLPQASAYPALVATAGALLHQLTALQAVNLLAQQQGHPYWLQVPLPDGDRWRTVYVALEPFRGPSDEQTAPSPHAAPSSQSATRFHVLIHAPLATLGHTWIDMSFSAARLHATLYFERESTLQQARTLQGELRALLQSSDFAEVGLELRPAADLPLRHQQQAAAMRLGRPPSVHWLDWEV